MITENLIQAILNSPKLGEVEPWGKDGYYLADCPWCGSHNLLIRLTDLRFSCLNAACHRIGSITYLARKVRIDSSILNSQYSNGEFENQIGGSDTKPVLKLNENVRIPKGGDATYGRWRVITHNELLARTEGEAEFIVEPYIPLPGVTILSGKPKIGKTWVLLSLAMCVQAGLSWLGKFNTTKGRVLYIDQENGDKLLGIRSRQIAAGLGLEGDIGIDWLVLPGLDLMNPDHIKKLDRIIRDGGYSLVIIDSFAKSSTGKEDSAQEMARISRHLRELISHNNCAIVIAHHTTKPYWSSPGSGQESRGSGEIVANADCYLQMFSDGDKIIIKQTLARWTEPQPSFSIKINTDEDDSVKVEFVDWHEGTEGKAGLAGYLILDALKEKPRDRAYLLQVCEARGVKRATVDRRIRQLKASGNIETRDVDGDTLYCLKTNGHSAEKPVLKFSYPIHENENEVSAKDTEQHLPVGSEGKAVSLEQTPPQLESTMSHVPTTSNNMVSIIDGMKEGLLARWNSIGAPVIHVGDRDNIFDLRQELAKGQMTRDRLEAIDRWLSQHGG